MAEYASTAVGNAGLATGIIGTTLGVLGGGASLLGVHGSAIGNGVTREEFNMLREMQNKDTQIAILTSERDENQKIADVYEKIMTKVNADQREQAAWNASQSVANAQMAAGIATNTASIAALGATLGGVTKTVIPNTAVCPGWGTVTITPGGGTTTT